MLATGKHNNSSVQNEPYQSNDNGFTLIELLVVVIIIGLMASVVVLNLPSNDKTLRQESDIVTARLHLVSQEAILTGNVIGLRIHQEGYSFMRRIQGQWVAYTPPGLKGAILWPENTKLDFRFEGEKITLSKNNTASGLPLTPNIYFLPSGETQNFDLTFSNPHEEETIQVFANAQISQTTRETP